MYLAIAVDRPRHRTTSNESAKSIDDFIYLAVPSMHVLYIILHFLQRVSTLAPKSS